MRKEEKGGEGSKRREEEGDESRREEGRGGKERQDLDIPSSSVDYSS